MCFVRKFRVKQILEAVFILNNMFNFQNTISKCRHFRRHFQKPSKLVNLHSFILNVMNFRTQFHHRFVEIFDKTVFNHYRDSVNIVLYTAYRSKTKISFQSEFATLVMIRTKYIVQLIFKEKTAIDFYSSLVKLCLLRENNNN